MQPIYRESFMNSVLTLILDPRFQKLCDFARANPGSNLTLPVLVKLAGVNRRALAKATMKATGLTPAKAIEAIRVEKACEMIVHGGMSIETISSECGFGSREVMRRAFIRRFGMSPTHFRTSCARLR